MGMYRGVVRGGGSVLCTIVLFAGLASAQEGNNPPAIKVTHTAQAFQGEPFGVAEVAMQFQGAGLAPWQFDRAPRITARQARVFYSAWDRKENSAADRPGWTLHCYFLFQGKAPLQVEVNAAAVVNVDLTPVEDPSAQRKLLDEWWSSFGRTLPEELWSRSATESQMYLIDMLGRRLKLGGSGAYFYLSNPAVRLPWADADNFLSLLIGTTSIRSAMQNDTLLSVHYDGRAAALPLPRATAPPPVEVPENLQADIAIEAIANYVPADCYYVRCHDLRDYVWLRALTNAGAPLLGEFGSHDTIAPDSRFSLEARLAAHADPQTLPLLAAAVSDLALIGRDLLFDEGPAVGLLLEARDERLTAMLSASREQTGNQPGVTLQQQEFPAGRATLLTSADGRVRSFYAVRGKYHLLTTSAAICRDFLASGNGGPALGSLPEFRYARQQMPLARNDSVFVYLSDPFFRQLVGPEFRIEMKRRAVALAEIRTVEMALQAARLEGLKPASVDALVADGFLPRSLLPRPDGSRTEILDGQPRDSLRGPANAMLPIADVEVSAVTLHEEQAYQRFAENYLRTWQRMDPVTLAISRKTEAAGERVILDFIITPYARSEYGLLAGFLQTTAKELTLEPGQLLTVQGNTVMGNLFAGLADFQFPPGTIAAGKFNMESDIDDNSLSTALTRPFLGITLANTQEKQLFREYYRWLIPREEVPAEFDAEGFGKLPLDSRWHWNSGGPFQWMREQDRGMTLGKSREELARITSDLKVVDAARPAQIRFHLGDLKASGVHEVTRSWIYCHARQVSAANVRLLWQLDQWHGVPPNEMAAGAQRLWGGLPQCPLGGEYRVGEIPGRAALWESSAWDTSSLEQVDHLPAGYRSPLESLQSLDIEFSINAATLSTHVEVLLRP